MLFLRFTPDRKAEVMESSTGGCNGKVCRNIYPLASLLARGYVPMRYRALANDKDQVAQLPPKQKDEPQAKRPPRRTRRGTGGETPLNLYACGSTNDRRTSVSAAADEAQRG
jgi:hypothetical protein